MIEARQLTKRYEDGTLGLDELDLTVEPGTIYCLLGANGAGKTTAINLFLDFIQPTSGEARIHGIDVRREPLKAKQHVAYLSENVQMYPNFTARQNLDFFARLARVGSLPRDQRSAVLVRAGLPAEAHDRKVKTFSKGMRQKLGIAVAMIKNAPALILDEPMSGLDPTAAAEFVHTLCSLRDESKAILMSTHDIFRAKVLADHIGIMKNGRKVAERTAAEIGREDLEALYLGLMQAEDDVPA
jgi:ABC-2 type transport system ATP-binding protein